MASDTLAAPQPSLSPTLPDPTASKTRQPSLEPVIVKQGNNSARPRSPSTESGALTPKVTAPTRQSRPLARAGSVEPSLSSQVPYLIILHQLPL
jgi:hypothetical protein